MNFSCSSTTKKIDRSLTKILLKSSKSLENRINSIQFCNHSPWIEGLNQWLDQENEFSQEFSAKEFSFHQDLLFYFPREEKSNLIKEKEKNSSWISSANEKEFLPLRLRNLIEKRKFSLHENDCCSSSLSLTMDEGHFHSRFDSMETNSVRTVDSKEKEKRRKFARYPLESINRDYFPKEKSLPRNRQDQFEKMIKEHLTSLLTRSATISTKRTSIQIPLINLKHENLFFSRPSKPTTTTKTTTIDSKLILQRYDKFEELLINSSSRNVCGGEHLNCSNGNENCSFGLRITPLELTSNDQSLNKSTGEILHSNHCSTKSNSLSSSSLALYEKDENHLFHRSKENFSHGFISSSGDFLIDEETCPHKSSREMSKRKFLRFSRSKRKDSFERKKSEEYFPPLLTGKRLHVSLHLPTRNSFQS